MRVWILILVLIIFIPNVSALCEEGQIDINSASAEELDEIKYIGPVKAQAIIDERPFDSLDGLIEVDGIGNWTLDQIKEQSLACVGEDEIPEEPPEEPAEEPEEETEEDEEPVEEDEESQEIEEIVQKETGPIELNMINLNPKVIKSENDNEKLSNNYAVYGFVFFCVLIIVLFVLRRNKYKNEFR